MCCRYGALLSSLTSVLVRNSSSRSAGCLDGSLGLDSGETQHETVFPMPGRAVCAQCPKVVQMLVGLVASGRAPRSHTAGLSVSIPLARHAKQSPSANSQRRHSSAICGGQQVPSYLVCPPPQKADEEDYEDDVCNQK